MQEELIKAQEELRPSCRTVIHRGTEDLVQFAPSTHGAIIQIEAKFTHSVLDKWQKDQQRTKGSSE